MLSTQVAVAIAAALSAEKAAILAARSALNAIRICEIWKALLRVRSVSSNSANH
jgi:hypothetical protein